MAQSNIDRIPDIRTGIVTIDSASTDPVTVELSPPMPNSNYKVFMEAIGANGAYVFATSATVTDQSHFSFVFKNLGGGGSNQRSISYLIVGGGNFRNTLVSTLADRWAA